jgi:hypothetical protein
MSAPDDGGGDPISEEAERARRERDRSLLPSNDGLGPGAGETPSADVAAGRSAGDEHGPDVTSTPSLGAPPRKADRPRFRTSQLDGAPPESEERPGG